MGEAVLLSVEDRVLRGLAVRKGSISVPQWESLLPAQALNNGMPEQIEILGDFLGDLVLNQGLMGQALRVALPLQAAHWRVITWPLDEWPDDPIEALRTLDPELGLPFALADAAIDLQPLPGRPLRSLLVAAPTVLVEAWSAVAEVAGVRLDRLLPAQVCLRQALLPALQAQDPRDGVLVLHPAGLACMATLWQQGVPLYERQFDADDPRLGEQLQEIVDYYGSHDSRFGLRKLLTTAVVPQQSQLAQTLQVPLEQLDWAPYDSPVMQGLAQAQ
ncbi:MAG: hypothetical protein VKM98_08895 [Cyanobacteriota bacterium]|nr:hypothetical protein [Cyanobacteriota bacterium]